MTEKEFLKFVGEIMACFNQTKAPEKKALEEWYQDVAHIPVEALNDIKASMKAECNSFPRNFSKAMRTAYRSCKGSSSGGVEAVSYRRVSSCTESQCADGLLSVWGRDDCRYVFRCLACNRSELVGIPGQYMGNLIQAGYVPESESENETRAQKLRIAYGLRHADMAGRKAKGCTVLCDEVEKIKTAHGWQ